MLVSATGPESSSSAPPLAFSTFAFAVSVNAATSPPRSPVSLKSVSVIPPAAAREAANDSKAQKMSGAIFVFMVVRLFVCLSFNPQMAVQDTVWKRESLCHPFLKQRGSGRQHLF